MAGDLTPDQRQKGGWHSGRFAHTFAAIDLGTNNCRLLVARASVDGFEVLDAYSRPVRLGEGVALSGTLCGEAIDRTLEALDVCASKIERHRVTRARHIATEACRRACNGEDFLGVVHARTGLRFEVIPPAEEARLALASCENLLDPDVPYGLLIDIGGGSTEVSWIKVGRSGGRCGGTSIELIDMTSVPWGVVTLTESCVHGHPRERRVERACYDEMVARIRADLRPFCARHSIGGAVQRGEVQMIGASGTVTTVSAHHLGLKRYNRTLVDGSRLSHESILRVCDQLSVMSVDELTTLPCIGTDRADLALAGGAILEAVCRQWPATMVTVADRGLREGVLMDLMRQADRDADPHHRRQPG
ncbi:MAG: Ppx/GppA family phosphatase [Reyranella sp.]|uniref:Ppx/GppA phosphatase family protein n=1 Tax=Reyranella sp. TaxID=1929291 RepID=UPI001AC459CB|nr:Ppx/GppA phosphatase family protein [Reyranella sp.]MBN9088876.1 Ppx/GppA family phosphatase [Reyranella sp.]